GRAVDALAAAQARQRRQDEAGPERPPCCTKRHFGAPSFTTTQLGCLHDLPSLVMATQRFFCFASATHTFQSGASTPRHSGSRPWRLLPLNLGPRVKVRYFMSGDQVM